MKKRVRTIVEFNRMPEPTHQLLVLASNSPRRRELLALTGLLFHVQSAPVDETPRSGERPRDFAIRMAHEKAAAVAAVQHSGLAVLAADTVVVDGDQILGKPADLAEADRMLRRLRGREHTVITAVAIQPRDADEPTIEVCETNVPMRDYADGELAQYLATGDSLDKAGAYGIQNRDFEPVAGLQGCFANVMGLPLCHVTRALRRQGVEPPEDVPEQCRGFTDYECGVFPAILAGQL